MGIKTGERLLSKDRKRWRLEFISMGNNNDYILFIFKITF